MPVMSRPQKKLTSAELLLLPDDGKRHELIDGVHYVTPSPRIPHQVLVGRIFVAISKKGVREYLLVDPKNCRVSICRRSGDGSFPIVSTLSAAADEQIETPLLPGFELSLSELFAEI